ncbi:hypothetical protein [Pedobacter sp. WC2423]|uniref:hypothetical protein n=1 Tax=Pedobacter sp. WC2423 TaxID=3234142 RepID=UPI00346587F4
MMNKFFKNVNTFGLTVVVIAGGLIFTQSAFKSANPNRFDTFYYFNGQDNSEMGVAGAWGPTLNSKKFVCNGQENTPCKIKVPAGQTLENYLTNHTDDQIINSSLSRRQNK